MNDIQKPNTSNSEALLTTEEARNRLSRAACEIYRIVGITDEKRSDQLMTEENFEESEDSRGYNIPEYEMNNSDSEENCINITDLCNRNNFESITCTNSLMSNSQTILERMAASDRHMILLIGDMGAGKKTAVKYAAYRIATGKCPAYFTKKSKIYEVDLNELHCELGEFVNDMNSVLRRAMAEGVKNVAIYFNDYSRLPGIFTEEYDKILSMLDTEPFDSFKFIVVYHDGTLVEEGLVDYVLDFFNHNAYPVEITSEDKVDRILFILRPRFHEIERRYNVKLSVKMAKFILMCHYGHCFEEKFNYTKFLKVVDEILAKVGLAGRDSVIKADVMDYYDSSFSIMRSLPPEYNKKTAIHESGHVLLALTIPNLFKLYGCSVLYDSKTKTEAITCIKQTRYCAYNEDDEVKFVAMLLAGRVAEIEMINEYQQNDSLLRFSRAVNSGAEDDLMKATEELRIWVMHSGAYGVVGRNVYNESYDELSPITKLRVDIVVDLLMRKAFRHARAVIRSNKNFIASLYKYLITNFVATPSDIKEILKQTINDEG
ncbi:MAG: hypothetical protein IKE01_00300 [Clostridia bacterium]|nr:hypothetical protein [Clostridia bacterium]